MQKRQRMGKEGKGMNMVLVWVECGEIQIKKQMPILEASAQPAAKCEIVQKGNKCETKPRQLSL